jgi:hypothetical protein
LPSHRLTMSSSCRQITHSTCRFITETTMVPSMVDETIPGGSRWKYVQYTRTEVNRYTEF